MNGLGVRVVTSGGNFEPGALTQPLA